MRRLLWICLLVVVLVIFAERPRRTVVAGAPVSPRARVLDEETIVGPKHYVAGYPARNPDHSVNAVVEIPSGTTAKFEVIADGTLRWAKQREDGARREIDYLAYPVNYGMVPGTLAPDGDTLDVLVLGRGIERGHVARTRVIAVLEMEHDDTRDDKLIAVPLEPELQNGFSDLHDITDLDERYPALRDILTEWFSNYWGPGATDVVGWGDAADANAILDAAITPRERRTPRAVGGLRPRAALPSGALAHSPPPPQSRSTAGSAY